MKIVLRYASDHRPITFSSLSVSRSLEGSFGQMQWSGYDRARYNEIVELLIDGALKFRGYLEVDEGNSREGQSFSARSLAVQIELFDALGNEIFRRTSLAAVLRALCTTAEVKAGAAPDERVIRFRLKRGETFREGLQRLAEAKRVVLTDDERSRLRMFALTSVQPSQTWRSNSGTMTAPVRRRIDFSEWRSTIECRGSRIAVAADALQSGNIDIAFGVIASLVRPSRRVLANKAATSKADAAALIEWEAKKQLASIATVTATHNAWVADTGDVVRLVAPEEGIDDVFCVSELDADPVRRSFRYTLRFPQVYLPRQRIGQATARPTAWGRAKPQELRQ